MIETRAAPSRALPHHGAPWRTVLYRNVPSPVAPTALPSSAWQGCVELGVVQRCTEAGQLCHKAYQLTTMPTIFPSFSFHQRPTIYQR